MASISSVVSASVIPARARPLIETPSLRRHHRARVRSGPPELAQPLGRVGLQRVQLVARHDALLELRRGGLEVHIQLLRRRRGLHRLGCLARRHGSSVVRARLTPGSLTAVTGQSSFRLGYVPGVTPAKWVRIWAERLPRVPLELIQVAAADAPGLVRARRGRRRPAPAADRPRRPARHSPVRRADGGRGPEGPRGHGGRRGDHRRTSPTNSCCTRWTTSSSWDRPPGRVIGERPAGTADAVALVAMGTGLLVVPQSLARLHHRKDLTYRPLTDAPESQVALSWPEDETVRAGGAVHRHRPRPDGQQHPRPGAGREAGQGDREEGQKAHRRPGRRPASRHPAVAGGSRRAGASIRLSLSTTMPSWRSSG